MPATPIPFSQFVRDILTVYDGPGHASRTRAKMRHVLGLVLGLGVESTEDLTTELAARFVRERAGTVTANTVRGDLSYLSAACSYAWEEGWLERCPRFKRVRPRPSVPARPKAHPIEDVRRLLSLLQSRSGTWCGARLYALASVAAYTALRRDELLYLMVQDVDLAGGFLRVVDRRRLKTVGAAALVPIPPELAQICAGWLPRSGEWRVASGEKGGADVWLFPGVRGRGPWTGGANGERPCDHLRRAGEELGIQGLTLQSLRHTWATWARRKWGLSALDVAAILRHTSPRTQVWYLHDDPDPMAILRAVNSISFG